MGVEIFVVPSDQVEIAWPDIFAQIDRVDEIDPEDVLRDLKSCKAQAWGLRDEAVLGFFITRVEMRRGKRYGLVWGCGGDGMLEGGLIDQYHAHVEPWFWSLGCEWIEIHARKGWQRLLPEYKAKSVVLVKRKQ